MNTAEYAVGTLAAVGLRRHPAQGAHLGQRAVGADGRHRSGVEVIERRRAGRNSRSSVPGLAARGGRKLQRTRADRWRGPGFVHRRTGGRPAGAARAPVRRAHRRGRGHHEGELPGRGPGGGARRRPGRATAARGRPGAPPGAAVSRCPSTATRCRRRYGHPSGRWAAGYRESPVVATAVAAVEPGDAPRGVW